MCYCSVIVVGFYGFFCCFRFLKEWLILVSIWCVVLFGNVCVWVFFVKFYV